MLFDLEKMLRHIKPKKLTEREKNILWSNISTQLQPRTASASVPSSFSLLFMAYRRSLVTLAIIFALVFGASTTAVFAHNTLPGDFFFPADVAAEKILLTLSFGDTEDTLRLRFAEERLDEVRALLALASSIEIHDDTGTSTDDTSTSTADTTESDTEDDDQNSTTAETDTSTSTESSDVDPIEEEFLNNFDFDVNTVEDALLFALAHLEEAKAVFASEGNALGVASINSFIDALNDMAQNHIAKLDRVSVTVDEHNDKVKIRVTASSDELKTKFNFTKETDSNGNTKQRIAFNDKDSKSNLRIGNDGKFKFSFNFRKNDHDDNGKKGHDDDDDDNDKKEDKKVYVCHKGKDTLHISKNARWAHILHGDEIGHCDDVEGDDNDDNDDDNGNGDEEEDTTAPEITDIATAPDVHFAVTSWTTDENATSKVWYSNESPVVAASTTLSVSDSDLTEDHALTLESLTASTTYFYIVESADASGNIATSSEKSFTTLPLPEPPADTTAPEISNIGAVASTTSLSISWDTDEDANSVVWYSTSTPVDTDAGEFVLNESLVMSHDLTVPSLTASTTYYYIVTSTDGAGNTATSSEESIDTLPMPEPPADTTPPEISGIEAVNISSTTATVNWTTDEDATSTIFYGTDDSLDPDTALSFSVGTLTSDHSFDLFGLSASTTYQYIVVSSDEALNTATSSQQSFITPAE